MSDGNALTVRQKKKEGTASVVSEIRVYEYLKKQNL
jgi:hypothetical protein